MIVTDRFVMLNLPKTGSTFAREVVRKIHMGGRFGRWAVQRGLKDPRMQELMMRQFHFAEAKAMPPSAIRQHGTYCQVPAQYRDHTIVSCVRDPFKRLVSLYECGAWKHQIFPSEELVRTRYPSFPDLGFDDFFDLECRFAPDFLKPSGVDIEIGPLTIQFIRFFARDPLHTIRALAETTDLRADYDLHFPQITYLHTENLNAELYDFLLTQGYPMRKLAFLSGAKHRNRSARSRTEYFTEDLRAELIQRERFFFQLFPEYLQQGRQ